MAASSAGAGAGAAEVIGIPCASSVFSSPCSILSMMLAANVAFVMPFARSRALTRSAIGSASTTVPGTGAVAFASAAVSTARASAELLRRFASAFRLFSIEVSVDRTPPSPPGKGAVAFASAAGKGAVAFASPPGGPVAPGSPCSAANFSANARPPSVMPRFSKMFSSEDASRSRKNFCSAAFPSSSSASGTSEMSCDSRNSRGLTPWLCMKPMTSFAPVTLPWARAAGAVVAASVAAGAVVAASVAAGAVVAASVAAGAVVAEESFSNQYS